MNHKKRVYFRFRSPEADGVAVIGSFSNWEEVRSLRRGKDGMWQTWMSLPPGQYEYRYLVDGRWTNDPEAPNRVRNSFGSENDVLVV